VGIGGLGHLALQFAKALGCSDVVAISSSDKKRDDAFKLGATDYVVHNEKANEKIAEKYDDLCAAFRYRPRRFLTSEGASI
jgi:alcohol dehydrogenase (NADP+)